MRALVRALVRAVGAEPAAAMRDGPAAMSQRSAERSQERACPPSWSCRGHPGRPAGLRRTVHRGQRTGDPSPLAQSAIPLYRRPGIRPFACTPSTTSHDSAAKRHTTTRAVPRMLPATLGEASKAPGKKSQSLPRACLRSCCRSQVTHLARLPLTPARLRMDRSQVCVRTLTALSQAIGDIPVIEFKLKHPRLGFDRPNSITAGPG
jgi:hypothetical protein